MTDLSNSPINQQSDLFEAFSESYQRERQESMSLRDYLLACRDDPMMYATPAERMIQAIGEPELIDTSKDPRLSRVHLNRTIKVYPAFNSFFGMEDTIERIVGFSNTQHRASKRAVKSSTSSALSAAGKAP